MSETIVKGFKAFDADLACRRFQYEVGKTYTHRGRITMCRSGFHFCTRCSDVFLFYPYGSGTRVCEIEALGKVRTEGPKSVTAKIRIVRELTWVEISDLCNKGEYNTGLDNTGDCNTGDGNNGCRNSGRLNAGERNTGCHNLGDYNVGNRNAGCGNRGSCNSGPWNTGNFNIGHTNTGNRNCGDCNTGHYNDGDFNTGNWNVGDYHTGYFNTKNAPVMVFDKPYRGSLSDIEVPSFFFCIRTCEWVDDENMTKKEKRAHPEWKTTRGYLRVYDYKEAWMNAFRRVRNSNDWESEKRKLLALPNFSFKKFEQLTGITKEDILGD